jgi:hypothetical protein
MRRSYVSALAGACRRAEANSGLLGETRQGKKMHWYEVCPTDKNLFSLSRQEQGE